MIKKMVVAVLIVLMFVPFSYSEEKIDLNTATESELIKLPGIGKKIAKGVVDYRELKGGFKSIEELMNITGIGEKKFNAIKDLITVKSGS